MNKTAVFDEFLEKVVKIETEKYTNDPDDSGGATKWGITEGMARSYSYRGEMKDMPYSVARDIYYHRFWLKPGLDLVLDISPLLTESLFQFGIVAGSGAAARHLQRVLNVLNRNGKDYPDIYVDGQVGRQTMLALKAFSDFRGPSGMVVLYGMVKALQTVHFIELAESRPKDEKYQFGWQVNRGVGQ